MEENKEIQEATNEKVINPSLDRSNYLIQVIGADGKVIKTSIALNSTISIVNVAEQSVAGDLK